MKETKCLREQERGPALNSNHRRPNNKTSKGSCCLTKSAWGVVIYIYHCERYLTALTMWEYFFSTITSQFAPLRQFNPLHLCLDSQETQYQILKRALEHAKYCPAHTYIHSMLKTIWINMYSYIYIHDYIYVYMTYTYHIYMIIQMASTWMKTFNIINL